MTSTCARRDHVIRTPRVVVAQRAHARARRACARGDHVTHAHLRTCASQSRDARRTTALRRTTASWRSTASRCATLDPALDATTSAALCALVVQRARARARGENARRDHAVDAPACSACSIYDRIVTHNGHTRLAALDDLATCGDLAQRTRVSWRATVTRPIALDASTRSNRLRHPRSLAHVSKSKTLRTTASQRTTAS